MSQLKTLALISARAGSKRVKNKNMRLINGTPLLWWTINAAGKCKSIEKLIVSTDSEEYATYCGVLGVDVLMRPKELAEDNIGDHEVIKHFLENYPCDLVIYLRPTTPFRKPEVIENAIALFKENTFKFDSLRSVEEMPESAQKCFYKQGNLLIPIMGSTIIANYPNQLVVPTYKGNGYVDMVKSKMIALGETWGQRCMAYETEPTIEIDTENDLWLAEQRLRKEKHEKAEQRKSI